MIYVNKMKFYKKSQVRIFGWNEGLTMILIIMTILVAIILIVAFKDTISATVSKIF